MYHEKVDNFLSVDIIRTVAVVLVILLHASTEPYSKVDLMSSQGVQIWWASNIYDSIARICIPLFIMLAGALLLQPDKADEPIRVFYKKRWARIGVPFIFWGILYFAWGFLIDGKNFNVESIIQGVLTGPYYHFWFLYLICGLYILTPVLRILVKHAGRLILKYVLVIWFIGTSIMPLLTLFGSFYLNANFFIFTGWIGYFVLGIYLTRVNIKRCILYLGLVGALLWTIIGTYLIIGSLGERFSQFFYDGFSVNMVIASAAVFLLLLAVPNESIQTKFPKINRVIKLISANTLSIFLFHVMVLETLQNGYLGVTLNITTMNPLISIPLITVLTLLICLAIIVPIKKIPYVKRIIG